MIDPVIAEFVLGQIGPGEIIEAYTGPENNLHKFELIRTTDYSAIVISPGVKPVIELELSVNKLKLYQDEVMRLQPPPEAIDAPKAAAKPRGRPAKQAAASPPNDGSWQTETVKHPTLEGVRVVAQPKQTKIEFEDDFVTKAVTEACDNFKNDMITLMSIIYANPPMDEKQPGETANAVKPLTCLHCVNMFDQAGTADLQAQPLCKRFNIIPPLFVMIDAKGKCPDFVESDFIPF